MRKITDLASLVTLLSLHVCLLFQVVLFFKPSLQELFVFFCVDLFMFVVAMKSDVFLFRFFYPGSGSFYPSLDEKKIAQGSDDEKRAIYDAMIQYPRQRALYLVPANLVKIIPASLVIIFYWQHTYAIWLATICYLSMVLFNISYMSAMAYLENHAFLSTQIRDIHRKHNWSSVFKTFELPLLRKQKFNPLEVLTILPIWLCVAALQMVIVFDDTQSLQVKVTESVGIAFFASFFTMRIIFVSRRQVLQGLETVFDYFSQEKADRPQIIPFNTSPVVAYCQSTINSLIERSNAQEAEISSWIIERMEKRRYLELGEIAGLVIHDLVTPLHSIRYCISSLQEEWNNGNPQVYLEQINASAEHSISLLKNLLTNIRTPNSIPNSSCIFEADVAVRKLLSYHFKPDAIHAIKFISEKPSQVARVSIPQPELNQIMMNLYSNSVKNLIANQVADPMIKLSIDRETDDCYYFRIEDNGTGLGWKDFEFITENQDSKRMTGGIGLRLTRRLVEHHEGSLSVLSSEVPGAGTVFIMELKKYQSDSSPSGH